MQHQNRHSNRHADIISALVDSYFDLNQEVSQASFNSLLAFSGKESNTVLLCCLTKFSDPKFNMVGTLLIQFEKEEIF